MSFFVELNSSIKKYQNHICIGIDPHRKGLGHFLEKQFATKPIATLEKFCQTLIELAPKNIGSLKFQSAFFEAFGADGMAILENAITEAKKNGLLVILDNKRGDIASTMAAYGEASFNILQADAVTVTPYMGVDCLAPLLPFFRNGKAAYIVWKTSNPNAGQMQNCVLADNSPYYMHVLNVIAQYAKDEGITEQLGFVLGATNCNELSEHELQQANELTGGRWLMPGFGAQGAKVTDKLQRIVEPGQHLIPISRGIYSIGEQIDSWPQFAEHCTLNIQSTISSLAVL